MIDTWLRNSLQWYQWSGNTNAQGQLVYFPGVATPCMYQGGTKVIKSTAGVDVVSTGEILVKTKIGINDRIEVDGKNLLILNFSDHYDIEGKYVFRTLFIS